MSKLNRKSVHVGSPEFAVMDTLKFTKIMQFFIMKSLFFLYVTLNSHNKSKLAQESINLISLLIDCTHHIFPIIMLQGQGKVLTIADLGLAMKPRIKCNSMSTLQIPFTILKVLYMYM